MPHAAVQQRREKKERKKGRYTEREKYEGKKQSNDWLTKAVINKRKKEIMLQK